MGFMNKLRDIKFNVSYLLEDAKDFIVDKSTDTKDFISDKSFDARYFLSDKVEDVKDFITDKSIDTKDFISDKSFDARYFLSDKVEDVKYFVSDKAFDAKYFITENVKIKSKADIVEVTSYVIFPAQIPLKALMTAMGKNASKSINAKNDELNKRISILEKHQHEGKTLNERLNVRLKGISHVKTEMHQQLEFFSEVFEKIHNRPIFNLSLDGLQMTFDELFEHSNKDADFARFDSYLLNIYAEDAGIMDGLMRSPVFAAILKFREKTLTNKITNVSEEVNKCINNFKTVNHYLQELYSIATTFEEELKIVETEFWTIVYALSELIDRKPDFNHFNNRDILLLDTNIKFVRVMVNLLNTHLFEKKDLNENGLAPINSAGIKHVIGESNAILNL